jgi:hypothetical protein
MSEITVSDFLPYLLKLGEWYKASPQCLKIVNTLDEEYGGNIAIGIHPSEGFFILHDQGIGPGLVWKEGKNTREELTTKATGSGTLLKLLKKRKNDNGATNIE